MGVAGVTPISSPEWSGKEVLKEELEHFDELIAKIAQRDMGAVTEWLEANAKHALELQTGEVPAKEP